MKLRAGCNRHRIWYAVGGGDGPESSMEGSVGEAGGDELAVRRHEAAGCWSLRRPRELVIVGFTSAWSRRPSHRWRRSYEMPRHVPLKLGESESPPFLVLADDGAAPIVCRR